MSINQQTSEPSSIYSGDTINWLIALPDYPANGGWTLYYTAVCAAGRFILTSVASGSDHLIQVVGASVTGPPAVVGTDSYTPGTYTLTKWAQHTDGSRVTLAELNLQVKANLAGKSAAYDNRTHVKKTLDAIEAVLEARASVDQQEVTIDGTTLKKMTVEQLLKFRSTYYNYYQQEIAAARIAQSTGSGCGRIRVRL